MQQRCKEFRDLIADQRLGFGFGMQAILQHQFGMTNDGLVITSYSIHYTKLYDGARPVLTQIRLPPNYGERYIRLFEAIYPDLADEHAVPLMPFFLESIIGHPELMLEDGLHPRPEAQPLIRDQVAGFLAPLLHAKG